MHMQENMAIFKRINITIHPIELEKLDRISEQNQETRSGMIARLIKDYNEKK
jgi:metal-responsive CopG/Arc/MetJ family transcriptional regulator